MLLRRLSDYRAVWLAIGSRNRSLEWPGWPKKCSFLIFRKNYVKPISCNISKIIFELPSMYTCIENNIFIAVLLCLTSADKWLKYGRYGVKLYYIHKWDVDQQTLLSPSVDSICSPSPAMVMSPYEWKILEWDEKPKQTYLHIYMIVTIGKYFHHLLMYVEIVYTEPIWHFVCIQTYTVESGANFRGLSIFFRIWLVGDGGGGLKGKRTPLKLILFETSYLSLQRLLKSLNDEDTDIGRFENATIC